jgi:tetratricopeptide (TPR) repeat protein
MRWQQTEFLLKGVYLGLLLHLALAAPTWGQLAVVGGSLLAGLALALAVAAGYKLREGYRVRGRWAPFLLFLLLEHPGLVYAGVLLGLALGSYYTLSPLTTLQEEQAVVTVGGGAVLGYLLWLLRHIQAGPWRRGASLALALLLTGAAVALLYWRPELFSQERWRLGAVLLLGLPGFYLLTFASLVEESEIEIAALCAALSVGLFLLSEQQPVGLRSVALGLPIVLYLVYVRYILPGLRVFKHILRGISYTTVGQNRAALASFSRALQLAPGNALAREQLWAVHRRMDLAEIANDPQTLALVSFDLCLERVASLLQTPPQAAQLQEAHRLLDLVEKHDAALRPRCTYWRTVALLHERRYAEAADTLRPLLGTTPPADQPGHWAVLLEAWYLALIVHPELRQRVGEPELAQPGRRMLAIAAVERRLRGQPADAAAWDLKRLLYSRLEEEEYYQAFPTGAAPDFDHSYVYQLGMELIEQPEQWRRGAAYLRLAARGMPAQAPSLFVQIARTCEKAGDYAGAWQAYEQAKQAGRAVGPQQLDEPNRHLYFAVVKMLAESARDDGRLEEAIENYSLYAQYERAGVATYRQLAELYERKGDAWAALRATEQGLVYDPQDADLLRRKDKYYYSVFPEEVRQRWENVKSWFDTDYCVRKARWLLERHGGDLDLLDWAAHLLALARAARPDSYLVAVLQARVHRLRGELPEAIALLESVRQQRPEHFPDSEEEDAWYLACRLLGDLYLEEHPERALECFQLYRQSPKSGADTLFKMGRAYEQLGDVARAVRCYRQVLAFEHHPLIPEAYEALNRLQATSS